MEDVDWGLTDTSSKIINGKPPQNMVSQYKIDNVNCNGLEELFVFLLGIATIFGSLRLSQASFFH